MEQKLNLVQLGANVGKDHVTDFINEYTDILDKILLVEAHPDCIEELTNNYVKFNVIIDQVAITHQDGKCDLHYLDGSNLRLSSVLHGVHRDFTMQRDRMKKVEVESLTLDSLFAKHKLDRVDVLFIDVEGIDETILSTFNPEKYNCQFIAWEHSHSMMAMPQRHADICASLKARGWELESKGANTIARKNNKLKTTLV
tara:strand:+ start:3729 stop:4325 length:597 start_codon:yes stop_codon:yes gene_type:complete